MFPRPSKRARRAVGRAATDAVIGGVERYGPDAVGLALVAVPICAIATFSHFILGTPAYVASVGAAASITLYYVARRRSRGKR